MASKEFLVDVVVNGDVGIGTDNPDSRLEVLSSDPTTYVHVRNNDGAGSTALKLSNKSDTNANGFQIINTAGGGEVKLLNHNNSDLGLWTNNQQRVVIDKGGGVGIGTDTPNRLLTVETASSGCYLALNSSNNNTTIGSDVNGAFIVYDDSSSKYRMVIDQTTGNVGIGTTNPNAELEVDGSVRVTGKGLDVGYGNNDTNYVQVGFGRTTNGFAVFDLIGDATYTDYGFRILRNSTGPNTDTDIIHRGTGDLDLKTIEAGDIGFWTTSSRRMIVKSNGDVGIGTDTPDARLEIAGHSSNGKFLLIDNVGGGETFLNVEDGFDSQLLQIKRETDNTISFNSYKDFNFLDNVGIKTTNPSYTLDVTGNIRATGSITENSDESLKENIQTIDNACDKVSKLRGVSYNKIGEEDKKIGVIAQEIEAVVPEVVTEDVDGIKSVSYTNLVGLLIQSNKELIERVSELENIINNKD